MSAAWPAIPLGEFLTERREAPSDIDLMSGKTRIVDKVSFNDGRIHLRQSQETKTGMILVQPGDILVSGINAAKGAIAIHDAEASEPLAATIHYGAYQADESRAHPKFLWWLLRSNFFRDLLATHVPGGIKTELKSKRLLPIPVPLPPLDEQRRIIARVEELMAKISTVRKCRDETKSECDALVGAILHRKFGRPDGTITGEIKIPKWACLGDVSDDVADGPHLTPTYVESGIPFITVLNITSGKVDFTNHKFVSREEHVQFSRRAKAERGDVLISKDGTIGVPCFVDTDKEFSFFVSVALVKPKRDLLDGKFLAWILRAPYMQERIRERSRGDMIRHLVLREIRQLEVPLLPLNKQQLIVAELDALQIRVSAVKALQQETAAELDAMLPAILDKAFKGEL